MAASGGRPRRCPDGGGPCGPGNPCIGATGKCLREYYQANSAAELVDVLNQIQMVAQKPCEYVLGEKASDPAFLSVEIDGKGVRSGPDSWGYVPDSEKGPTVFLLGSLCEQVKNATKDKPVQVDIRIVRTL
jgi:hypothetical protein